MQACGEISLPESDWLRLFRRRMIAWYGRHRRDLPWRGTRDPYAVWISEIMLQQTTTQAVRGYFTRFLERFPTVESLAAAELAEVNRLWEGLGYYRRASQMHRAAREIVEKYDGVFPDDYETVLALPGIGRYTAGAILSIARDRRLPILEANTIRLHARLLAYPGDTASKEGQNLLWAFAEKILPARGRIGAFNQSLMDLGSLICTPYGSDNPHCSACPVFTLCGTAAAGLQDRIPAPKKQAAVEFREEIAVVLRRRGRILLQQQPEGERWAGLWDFPKIILPGSGAKGATRSLDSPQTVSSASDWEKELSESVGFPVALGRELLVHRHTVTRFRITLRVFEGTVGRQKLDGPCIDPQSLAKKNGWFSLREIRDTPLNSPARKVFVQIFGRDVPEK